MYQNLQSEEVSVLLSNPVISPLPHPPSNPPPFGHKDLPRDWDTRNPLVLVTMEGGVAGKDRGSLVLGPTSCGEREIQGKATVRPLSEQALDSRT